MIYVRAYVSIRIFPYASFALFIIYHFYYYSYPFGFHMLALLVMQFLLVALMIHVIRVFECDAYYRGLVNIDTPRMCYNTTPWPTWNGSLAPDLTIFMPVSERSAGVYQIPVVGVNNANNAHAVQTNNNNQNSENGIGPANGTRHHVDIVIHDADVPGARGNELGGANVALTGTATNSAASSGGTTNIQPGSTTSGDSSALRPMHGQQYQSFHSTNPPPGSNIVELTNRASQSNRDRERDKDRDRERERERDRDVGSNTHTARSSGVHGSGMLSSMTNLLRGPSSGTSAVSAASATYSRLHRDEPSESKDDRVDDSV
jgi:hypothetical protein